MRQQDKIIHFEVQLVPFSNFHRVGLLTGGGAIVGIIAPFFIFDDTEMTKFSYMLTALPLAALLGFITHFFVVRFSKSWTAMLIEDEKNALIFVIEEQPPIKIEMPFTYSLYYNLGSEHKGLKNHHLFLKLQSKTACVVLQETLGAHQSVPYGFIQLLTGDIPENAPIYMKNTAGRLYLKEISNTLDALNVPRL